MNKPKILVVEDDSITRFMMTEMCDQLGHSYEAAENGLRCIEMLAEDPLRADVILMDIHMPDVSGLEVCALIRNRSEHPPRNLPVIAVTADEFWHDAEHCSAAGFDNVLPKPISINMLQRALTQIMKHDYFAAPMARPAHGKA